jgi:hypothetical protein
MMSEGHMRRTVLASVAVLFCGAIIVRAAEAPALMSAVKAGDAAMAAKGIPVQ